MGAFEIQYPPYLISSLFKQSKGGVREGEGGCQLPLRLSQLSQRRLKNTDYSHCCCSAENKIYSLEIGQSEIGRLEDPAPELLGELIE